jgi:hypothetical protein
MLQNIRNPYFTETEQRRQLDLVQKLNGIHSRHLQKDPQLEARIEAYEMAYRMQMEATDAFESKEPQTVRELWDHAPRLLLLIARRLVERG